MIIELTDDWRIEVIPLNFCLQQKVKTKPSKKHPEGSTKWKTYGYYSGFESALRALPDALAQCPDILTFNAYMKAWQGLARDIEGKMLK